MLLLRSGKGARCKPGSRQRTLSLFRQGFEDTTTKSKKEVQNQKIRSSKVQVDQMCKQNQRGRQKLRNQNKGRLQQNLKITGVLRSWQ